MAPRKIAVGISVVFIGFLSLLSLDVFGEGYAGLELLVALTMHLIPSAVLLSLTLVSWRWPLIGGYLFIATSIAMTFFFHTYEAWQSLLLISSPPLIIGLLFFLEYQKQKKR